VPIIDTLPVIIASRLIVSDSGCWLWTGATNGQGYGKHRGQYVHRLVYEALVGPIPAGHEIDHLCRVHACSNPSHLEPVTHRENMLRGAGPVPSRAAQTACIHGHAFDDRNTYRPPDGTRACRRCRADHEKARRARLRQEPAA
jgi:hypothetical protein